MHKCLSHSSGLSIILIVFNKNNRVWLAWIQFQFQFLNVLINFGTGFISDDDLVDVHEVLEAGFPHV